MTGHENTSELLARARANPAHDCGELLESYRNYLKMVARLWLDQAWLASVDPSDLVQETCLKAFNAFADFRGTDEVQLVHWLRQILARSIIDLARKHKTEQRRLASSQTLHQQLDDSLSCLANVLPAKATSPSKASERRELGVILANGLASLSADQREVIVLRSLEQLPWQNVARQMNRSADAARMLWTRALRELRPKIESQL